MSLLHTTKTTICPVHDQYKKKGQSEKQHKVHGCHQSFFFMSGNGPSYGYHCCDETSWPSQLKEEKVYLAYVD